MPLIEEIPNNIVQNEYIKLVSDKINIDESALIREVNRSKMFQTIENKPIERIVTKSSNNSEKAQKNLLSLFFTSVTEIDLNYLKEVIKNVKFTNKNLIIIKEAIDKLLYRINNNVDELIQALYTQFAEDNELKDIITDLIYIADSFKNLSERDFKAAIRDNVNSIQKYHFNCERHEIAEKYKQLNDDDIESMQYQMQLREKIKNKHKVGE